MVRLSLELIEPVKEGKVGRSGRAIILAKLVETNSYKIQWKKKQKEKWIKIWILWMESRWWNSAQKLDIAISSLLFFFMFISVNTAIDMAVDMWTKTTTKPIDWKDLQKWLEKNWNELKRMKEWR